MAERPERTTAPLRILVVRSGGFAGISREWCVEPDGDADDWVGLIDACPWDRVGHDPGSRDRFVWRIEARVRRQVRTAKVPDRELTGPWRELVDRVRSATDGEE
jgi:hypothetical protein